MMPVLYRRLLCAIVVAVAALAARSGRAAPCPVIVTGVESAAWQEAAGHVVAPPAPDDDCARVELVVGADGALLIFHTRDGRRVERVLRDPGDLAPTLAALQVTDGFVDAAPTRAVAVPPLVAEGAPAALAPLAPVAVAARSAIHRPAPPSLRWAVQLGMYSGSDLGWQFRGLALGMISLRLDSWELGPIVAVYPSEAGAQPSAGLALGRRWSVGPHVAILGLRSTIAVADQVAEPEPEPLGKLVARDRPVSDGSSPRGIDARAGVYGGAAFPLGGDTRLRVTLAGELSSAVPGPAATLIVGMER